MFYAVITHNNVNAELFPFVGHETEPHAFETDIPVVVLCHKESSMVRTDVIAALVVKWKASFHESERPIQYRMKDALSAFANWVQNESRLGYATPFSWSGNLMEASIYDVVEE